MTPEKCSMCPFYMAERECYCDRTGHHFKLEAQCCVKETFPEGMKVYISRDVCESWGAQRDSTYEVKNQ